MLLLDIEKAFDKVWINGLIYKLVNYKFPFYLIKLIHNYLTNRTFKIKVNNSFSEQQTPTAGVPQGSVLGPVLFTYYINDIPQFAKTQIAIFADDTAIYAHSHHAQVATKQLQIHLGQILEWAENWKIRINNSKTENIIFTRKRTDLRITSPIKIQNLLINPTEKVKYLGIHLDKRLNFNTHLNSAINKGHGAIKSLYPLINKNSKMSIHNKKLIYTSMIRPIITYASPVSSNISKTKMLKLQRFQNKCLRLILNTDNYTPIDWMHLVLDIPTIDTFIKKQANQFFETRIKYNNLTFFFSYF